MNTANKSAIVTSIVSAFFVSVWAEGNVESGAKLDLATGRVFDIEASEDGDDFEHLESEHVEPTDRSVELPVKADGNDEYYVDAASLTELRRIYGYQQPAALAVSLSAVLATASYPCGSMGEAA